VPHRVTLTRRLDLDDLCTHVSEQLATEGTGDERAQLEHSKIGHAPREAGVSVMAARLYHRPKGFLTQRIEFTDEWRAHRNR
jgi:hypothetical protein